MQIITVWFQIHGTQYGQYVLNGAFSHALSPNRARTSTDLFLIYYSGYVQSTLTILRRRCGYFDLEQGAHSRSIHCKSVNQSNLRRGRNLALCSKWKLATACHPFYISST
ncbi:hypothetical protein D3C71_1292820 [compost metagenome]